MAEVKKQPYGMKDIFAGLQALKASPCRFRDAYAVMQQGAKDRIFAEELEGGRVIRKSYVQLDREVRRFAAGLKAELSGKEGGYIALEMENSSLWVVAFWGILMAGFKPLLVNTRMDSQSRESAKSEAACLDTVGEERVKEILAKTTTELHCYDAFENEIVLLSSGTTGAPKLIVYDGRAICSQILLSGEIVRKNKTLAHNKGIEVKHLAFLPFYHIFGLVAVLLWFSIFSCCFVFPTALDARSIQYACKRCGVTHFFGIPLVWESTAEAIFKEAERQGKRGTLEKAVAISIGLQNICPPFGKWVARNLLFRSVRKKALGETLHFCISGGGFIKAETLRLMTGLGYTMHNGYGMTEVGIASVELSEFPKYLLSEGVGQPFSCVKTRLNEEGLLYLRSDCAYVGRIVKGCFEKVEANTELCTDDLAEITNGGRLRLRGRFDDLIIGKNGENISPDLIEERLRVKNTDGFCILGLPFEDGDVIPVAVLYYAPTRSAYSIAASVETFYRDLERIPLAQRPRAVYRAEKPLPEGNGKVRRALLRESLIAGLIPVSELKAVTKDAVERVYDENYEKLTQEILSLFAEITGSDRNALTVDSHFIYDAGGDSLKYYDLLSRLSVEHGTDLGTGSETAVFTPAELAAAILGKRSSEESR